MNDTRWLIWLLSQAAPTALLIAGAIWTVICIKAPGRRP